MNDQTLSLNTAPRGTITPTRLLVGMICLYAVWIALFGALPIRVMGIPAFTLYFVLLAIVVVGKVLLQIGTRAAGITCMALLSLVGIVSSILRGWSAFTSLFNAMLYLLPLAFLYLPRLIHFDMQKFCKCIQVMVFVGGVFAILIYSGLIDSGMRLKLSITKLDNTIGLLGIATAFYLFSKGDKLFSATVTLVMALAIILTGQSRSRMILSVVIIFLYLIRIVSVRKPHNKKSIVLLVMLFLVALWFVNTYSDEFAEYLGFAEEKFATIGEDSSSVYRAREAEIHMELLLENPLFGIGVGALNSTYRTSIDSVFYGHNMLTAAFAMYGLVYGICSLLLLSYFLVVIVRNYWKNKTSENFFALVLYMTVITLSVTSAGFSKYSTHIMMLCIGIALQQHKEEQRKKPSVRTA